MTDQQQDRLFQRAADNPSLRNVYWIIRSKGHSRPIAILMTPVIWLVLALAVGLFISEKRRHQKRRERIKQEERWRQEVREDG